MMMALNNSKTALTEMPMRRKGINKSQIIGYRKSARMARGQHKIKRISHNKNLATSEPPSSLYHIYSFKKNIISSGSIYE
jgi:hypothetical protein